MPQVTRGSISLASKTTSLSKTAPSSDGRSFHSSTASSKASPFSICGRPLSQAKVVSSGAIIPTRAPISIAILHTVIRPSIDRERIASPANSTAYPAPPAVVILLMMYRMTSLADTPGPNSPLTTILIVFIFF